MADWYKKRKLFSLQWRFPVKCINTLGVTRCFLEVPCLTTNIARQPSLGPWGRSCKASLQKCPSATIRSPLHLPYRGGLASSPLSCWPPISTLQTLSSLPPAVLEWRPPPASRPPSPPLRPPLEPRLLPFSSSGPSLAAPGSIPSRPRSAALPFPSLPMLLPVFLNYFLSVELGVHSHEFHLELWCGASVVSCSYVVVYSMINMHSL